MTNAFVLLAALAVQAPATFTTAGVAGADTVRPRLGPPKPFVAPPVTTATLANGLRIARVRFGTAPIARVELVIRTGTSDEGAAEVGLAELVGDFLREGTTLASAEQLARAVAELGPVGGEISVSVSPHETMIAGEVLAESAPALVRLIADVAQRPAFPSASLERLRANRLRRLALQSTQAPTLAVARANAILFPGHPSDQIPTEADLRGLTVDAVRRFHGTQYGAARSRLYVAGMFDDAAVETAAREAFGDWASGTPPSPLPQSRPFVSTPSSAAGMPTIQLIDRPGATQARVLVTFPVVDQAHPDHIVLNQLNLLMGSVQTSRIIANVREKHGYSYNVSTRLVRRPGSTQWTVAADVAKDVVGAALTEILSEVRRIAAEAPPSEELRRYQVFSAGLLIAENSNARGILESLRWIDLYGVEPNYLSTQVQRTFAVTPADVQRVAAMYFDPARLVVVVVGDRAALAQQLATIGRVIE